MNSNPHIHKRKCIFVSINIVHNPGSPNTWIIADMRLGFRYPKNLRFFFTYSPSCFVLCTLYESWFYFLFLTVSPTFWVGFHLTWPWFFLWLLCLYLFLILNN